MRASTPSLAIDVSALLDHGPWSGLQKTFVFLSALAIVFDGFSIQLLGFAIPALVRDWQAPRSAFAPVLAAGLFGMALGSVAGGRMGDRFGRRAALIANVLLFGLASAATALVHGIGILELLRFVAGAGIGGALPNACTLSAEFTPVARRALAVSLTIVCVPLGGMLGGLVAAQVLPTLGWRALFAIGGLAPLALAALLAWLLPESPRYLVRRPNRWPELARLLSRMGRPAPATAAFADRAEEKTEGRTVKQALFGPGQMRDTLSIWVSFFFCLGCVYMVFNWLPAMLTAQGLNLAAASTGLASYNLGGVLGAVCCAGLVGVFGSRAALLAACLGGIASALALRAVPITPGGGYAVLIVALGVHGFFVNAVQTTMYALAAHLYTTRTRATGMAFAISVGRAGAILSALIGSQAIQFGRAAFLNILAAAMAGSLIALMQIGNHIPRSERT